MGCLQATEVLKILLKRHSREITSGRVMVFDALKMKFSDIGLAKQDDRETITDLIDYQGFCAGPKPTKPAEPVEPGVRSMDEVETSCSKGDDSFHSIEPKVCLNKLSKGWTPWVLVSLFL
jgi:adenylyltransferase/sulfurtransferase